jgi:hypothetical protein
MVDRVPWQLAALIVAMALIQTLWLRKRLEDNQVQTSRKLVHLMALVQIDQSVLDAFGTTLNEIADAVQAIVDDEDNPLGDADVTGITAPIARLQEILTTPEEPVEPPVEPPV